MSEAESSDPAPDVPLGLPTLVNCDEDAKTHAWGYFHARIKQSNPKLDFGRFKNHLQKNPAFQHAIYWDKSRIRQLYTECMEHFSALTDVGKKEVGKSRVGDAKLIAEHEKQRVVDAIHIVQNNVNYNAGPVIHGNAIIQTNITQEDDITSDVNILAPIPKFEEVHFNHYHCMSPAPSLATTEDFSTRFYDASESPLEVQDQLSYFQNRILHLEHCLEQQQLQHETQMHDVFMMLKDLFDNNIHQLRDEANHHFNEIYRKLGDAKSRSETDSTSKKRVRWEDGVSEAMIQKSKIVKKS